MNLRTLLPALTCASFAMTFTSVQASEQGNNDPEMCGFAISARFVESAPRDRFLIENTSTAAWTIRSLNVDLSTSAGNLIFDTTADGAGVEVFQPFRDDGGAAVLAQEPVVSDGDQLISLAFTSFKPDENYEFSIDIDDQLANSDLGQIRVSSGEIAGTGLQLELTDDQGKQHSISAVFDTSNQVLLSSADC